MARPSLPRENARKGLPMTDLDWELLAVLNEVDPLQADYLIWQLAEWKQELHSCWVEDRLIWEHFNPHRIREGFAAPLSDEPFVGVRYDS